jgi:hypothetical protein
MTCSPRSRGGRRRADSPFRSPGPSPSTSGVWHATSARAGRPGASSCCFPAAWQPATSPGRRFSRGRATDCKGSAAPDLTAKVRHSCARSVPVFLTERQALQPHTGPGTWGGRSSNIRPCESGICRAQALPGDPNRFAINGLGLCLASAHMETARVAMRLHSSLSIPLAMPVHSASFFPDRVPAGVETAAAVTPRRGPAVSDFVRFPRSGG